MAKAGTLGPGPPRQRQQGSEAGLGPWLGWVWSREAGVGELIHGQRGQGHRHRPPEATHLIVNKPASAVSWARSPFCSENEGSDGVFLFF